MQIGNNIINQAIYAALVAGKEIIKIYASDDFDISRKEDDSPLTKADRAAHALIVSFLKETEYPILSEEGKSIPYASRKDWHTFWLVDPLDGTKEFIKRNGEFTVNIALIEEGSPVMGVVNAPVLEQLFVGISGVGAWRAVTTNHGIPLEEAEIKDEDSGAGIERTVTNVPNLTIEMVKKLGSPLPLSPPEASSKKHSHTQRNPGSPYRVVASRSHRNPDTEDYLAKLEKEYEEIEVVSRGSSLKLCMIATGEADEYPRLGPTMEWDTAAAHAVVKAMGKKVRVFGSQDELEYNKPDLLNPYFMVK